LSSLLVSFAAANPLFDPELFNSEYFELESIDTSPHNNGTAYNSNFGINYVDCASSYFRPGAYWPLQSAANAGTTVRLCNNVFGKQHYYATLFSVTDRIPVYSAGKFRRTSGPTYARPNDTWEHLAMGLCLPSGTSLPTTSSFYSNFASVSKSDHAFCSRLQPTNDDYKGNTSTLKIDRGHLLPNGIYNQDLDAAKATFTLTNVAPQHSTFNQQAWNQLECMVRKYLEIEIPNKYAFILTGTHGTKQIMNQNDSSKNNVKLPARYWKAFCYSGTTTYAWVYVQVNQNDQNQSSGDYFMSPNDFSRQYYSGQSVFDRACQNADMGPWNAIADDWSGYRRTYGC